MRIHWSYKSLPELSALSDAERRAAWRRAVWKAYDHWQTWVSLLLTGPWILIGRWIGSSVGHQEIEMLIRCAISAAINNRVIFRFARPYLTPNGSSAGHE